MRILVVEDETDMQRLIAASLAAAGFVVDSVGTLADAEAAASTAPYALLVLDRRMPDGDGASRLGTLRALQPGVPIILVSALDAVADRIRGLDGGADDYLTKPFAADELLARMRAALRRPGAGAPPPIVCGRLRFLPASREVFLHGMPLILKRRELALLEALIRRVGRVVQRDTLLEEIYGFDDDVQSNTLDAHVSRLRARLAPGGVAIHPVRGVGYLMDAAG